MMVGLVAQWIERATLIYEEHDRLINPDPGNPNPKHWNVPNGEDAIRKAFDLLFTDGRAALLLLAEMQDTNQFGGLFAVEFDESQLQGAGEYPISWLEFVRIIIFEVYKEYPGLEETLFPQIDQRERELRRLAEEKSSDPDAIQYIPIPV
jgi:hypothetical protein